LFNQYSFPSKSSTANVVFAPPISRNTLCDVPSKCERCIRPTPIRCSTQKMLPILSETTIGPTASRLSNTTRAPLPSAFKALIRPPRAGSLSYSVQKSCPVFSLTAIPDTPPFPSNNVEIIDPSSLALRILYCPYPCAKYINLRVLSIQKAVGTLKSFTMCPRRPQTGANLTTRKRSPRNRPQVPQFPPART